MIVALGIGCDGRKTVLGLLGIAKNSAGELVLTSWWTGGPVDR